MLYDDGSSLTTYDDGSTLAIGTDGASSSTPVPSFSGDRAESMRLQGFSQDQSVPWWQSMATYGFTRAIDNHYRNPPTPSGSQPATYSGQNGRTYANGVMVPNDPLGIGSIPPVLLLGGLALLVYMTAK